jgi:hypothetical protein
MSYCPQRDHSEKNKLRYGRIRQSSSTADPSNSLVAARRFVSDGFVSQAVSLISYMELPQRDNGGDIRSVFGLRVQAKGELENIMVFVGQLARFVHVVECVEGWKFGRFNRSSS